MTYLCSAFDIATMKTVEIILVCMQIPMMHTWTHTSCTHLDAYVHHSHDTQSLHTQTHTHILWTRTSCSTCDSSLQGGIVHMSVYMVLLALDILVPGSCRLRMRMCVYTHIHTYMEIYIHLCVYVCIYIYIYTYIHIYGEHIHEIGVLAHRVRRLA